MSTALQGLVLNPHGYLPANGATVRAVSTDGLVEGSTTTDANGHFSLTGLTNRNWLARVTSAPVGGESAAHIILLLPNSVDHEDLSSITADQHHAGFIGLLDNASAIVGVDANDFIRITDDGIINADRGGEEGGILALTIDQTQIDHGTIGGLTDDDHDRYAQLGGRSGGQTFYGGDASGDDLTLVSTSHATVGSVFLGSSSLFELDESTGQIKIPTVGSGAGILVGGDALWYRVSADVWRTPDGVTIDGLITSSGGITGSGVNDFGGATSFELPNSATPTVNADGEIALDTTVADFSHGLLRYYGGEELVIIAVPTADIDTAPTDGYVLAYNATDDEFEFVAGAGGHGTGSSISDHGEVAAITETQGQILRVNATPAWEALAAQTAGAHVGGDGTDVVATVPKRTIILTAAGGKPTTTAGCADAVVVEAGTNDVDYWVLDFDNASDEYAFWGPIPMPANYDGGVMTAIFYWTTTATGTTGVAWAIQLLSLDDGDPIDSAWGTAVVVTDDAQSAAGDVLVTAASGDITPGGTASAPEMLFVRVFRDVSDANDDMTEDARLKSVKLLYNTNAISD